MTEESYIATKVNLETLFTSPERYIVPPNNRDYAWTKNNEIQDFWDDLKESMKKSSQHFFGTMFFVRTNDEKKFEVLDGQQRLATVTILLSVIRDIFHDIDDIREKATKDYITGKTDLKSLTETMRLKLNIRNQEFFSDCIQSSLGSKERKNFNEYHIGQKLEDTNELIKDAYAFFYDKLNEEIKNKDKKQKSDYLADVADHVLKKFAVIKTVVSEYDEAYELFEAINFRGLELSISDLFKNYVIGKTPKDKKDFIIAKWNELATLLDDTSVKDFLRQYWASKIGNVTVKELYREVKKYLKDKDIVSFVKELRDEAELYNALLNPKSEYWNKGNKVNEKITNLLDDIKTLNIKQCFPLLLSCKDNLDDEKFKDILQICINFSFRYITIAGFNNKILEKLYSDLAIKVRKKEITNASEISKELHKKYVNDEQFLALFQNKDIRNTKVAKYILMEIETRLNPLIQSDKETIPKTITLEHILPKSPDREWITYMQTNNIEKEELLNKIGNLTLLTEPMNRGICNKDFTTKKKNCYNNSTLKINESLKSIKEWNDKEINTRQKWLGETAREIWKIS